MCDKCGGAIVLDYQRKRAEPQLGTYLAGFIIGIGQDCVWSALDWFTWKGIDFTWNCFHIEKFTTENTILDERKVRAKEVGAITIVEINAKEECYRVLGQFSWKKVQSNTPFSET